jgi:hypothetical protein
VSRLAWEGMKPECPLRRSTREDDVGSPHNGIILPIGPEMNFEDHESRRVVMFAADLLTGKEQAKHY